MKYISIISFDAQKLHSYGAEFAVWLLRSVGNTREAAGMGFSLTWKLNSVRAAVCLGPSFGSGWYCELVFQKQHIQWLVRRVGPVSHRGASAIAPLLG